MPSDNADVLIPGVELGDVLGAGAFGTVRRGRHRFLDIDVAVKLLDLGQVEHTLSLQLLQEARLMARLDHPNLLRVFDAGSLPRHLYLVLELMDGGSCADLHEISAPAASAAAMQLLSGLQAMHDARMLHRDIKPANCLRRGDNRIKLADLGLAMTMPVGSGEIRETAGTLPFMAPELFETPPRYGPASDLYALGMTLAVLVLDRRPYPAGGLTELLPWILNRPPISVETSRPDLPRPLSMIIDRLISPRAIERPSSAAAALADLSVLAPVPSSPAPVSKSSGQRDQLVVGPWIIGAPVYASSNWEGWTVTHRKTGSAGRLMRLKPDGPLRGAGRMIHRSAERAAQISDRGVVPVLDWGVWDDRVYVVTAAWGQTIQDLVRASGPFDEVSALQFGRDLSQALSGIHARGLVYQNLDPGSAVIAADARTAQLSWPIYCVEAGTSAESRIVVPRYAAPEALFGSVRTIETPVDVFGLGAVLLFMLTGVSPPREGESIVTLVRSQAPDVTAATASFVGDLLTFSPDGRPSAPAAAERVNQLLSRLSPTQG